MNANQKANHPHRGLTLPGGFVTFLICALIILVHSPESWAETRTEATALQLAQEYHHKRMARKVDISDERSAAAQESTAPNLSPISWRGGPILGYLVDYSSGGYAVVPIDEESHGVIAYATTGSIDLQDLRSPIVQTIFADLERRHRRAQTNGMSKSRSAESDEEAPPEGESPTRYPDNDIGWLTDDTWDQGEQGSHFNDLCPIDPQTQEQAIVGCVATAMAQVVNYWQLREGVRFSSGDVGTRDDSYTSRGDGFPQFDVDSDSEALGFADFEELNQLLAAPTFDGTTEFEALLSFACGVSTQMQYGTSQTGSGADTLETRDALIDIFGYGSALSTLGTEIWADRRNEVIENLRHGMPVIAGLALRSPDGSQTNGHAVVLEGYDETDDLFLVNFGWGATNDGTWWNLPAFLDESNSPPLASFNLIRKLVYDIIPNHAWPLPNHDAKNTRHTAFQAPDLTDLKDRFSIRIDADLGVAGVVVGPGGKLVITAKKTGLGAGERVPKIFIANSRGTIETSVPLAGSESVSKPSLGEDEAIFVASDTELLRIDAESHLIDSIYTAPSGHNFETFPQIDGQGRIYASSQTALFSVTPDGAQAHIYVPPGGDPWIEGIPAIDEAPSRNRVYLSSYDWDTRVPTLHCLNRTTLAVIDTIDFPAASAGSIGSPVISDDGTVYLRSTPGTLYALRISAGSLRIVGQHQFEAGTTGSIALGDQNLYTTYWRQKAGSWGYYLGGFSLETLTQSWELGPFTEDTSDGSGSLMAFGREQVLFTIRRENGGSADTAEVISIRDNGSSATLLGRHDYGTRSSALIPGTAGTVLSYGGATPQNDHYVYAMSDGDRGDPDGGGMNFENNLGPAIPANPGPMDGTTEVPLSGLTLTWQTGHPDGRTVKSDLLMLDLSTGDDEFHLVAEDLVASSFTPKGLRAGSKVLWKVVTSDGQDEVKSPLWSFSVAGHLLRPHPYDKNEDFSISDFDLLSMITDWQGGRIQDYDPDFFLLHSIGLWQAGSYTNDSNLSGYNTWQPEQQ